MDPNATLMELRALAQAHMDEGPEETGLDVADAVRMAELVQALDEWITRGGFLPDAWQKGRV